MIYKNMGEALSCNAFKDFERIWGCDAFTFQYKEWDEHLGWVNTTKCSICSKQQYNVASKLRAGSFSIENDILIIETVDYSIRLSPKGRVTYWLYSLDESEMQEFVEGIYPYFKEIFEKCR